MQVDFVECSVRYFQKTVVPKFEKAHWLEVGQDKHWTPELDWDSYRFLERNGMLLILVLLVDNEPQGYFVGLSGHPTHYVDKWIMRSDLFYIAPNFRQYGVRLFRTAEQFAKAMGVQKLYISYKTYKDITPIMKRLKFMPVEIMAVKNLE